MTDLSYVSTWDTVIVLDDWLSPNKYECKIYFDIETDNSDHQNIAFERCKVMMESIFNQSLFIKMDNPLVNLLNKKTKQRIITLPNEPLDIIMAAITYYKLSAICEGRLIIREVKLKSTQGDNIWVHFNEEWAQEFSNVNCEFYKSVEETPWWFRADAAVSDWFEISNKKQELKFHFHKSAWDKTLQWDQTDNVKSAKVGWKPRVIAGGKETKH